MPRPDFFETSPFPIVVVNIETLKIPQTNQAAGDFFGYHGYEMPNRDLHGICAADGVEPRLRVSTLMVRGIAEQEGCDQTTAR